MSAARRNGHRRPGALPPSARMRLERTWLRVLAARHPDVSWRIVRPGELRERDATAAAGKVVGSLAGPDEENALLERDGTAGAANGTNDDGVEGR